MAGRPKNNPHPELLSRLALLQEHRAVSQRDLARELGISSSTFNRFMSSGEASERLARTLELAIQTLPDVAAKAPETARDVDAEILGQVLPLSQELVTMLLRFNETLARLVRA